MRGRAASGSARTTLALSLAGALMVAAVAGLAACGGSAPTPAATITVTATPTVSPPAPSPSPSSTAMTTTTVSLYFLRDGRLGVAERRLPRTSMPATAALGVLLKGPSAAARAAGLSTNIAAGTGLNTLTLAGGTATVDFTSRFAQPAANAVAARRVAQVVYTLTAFPAVRRVIIEVDGRRLDAIASGGVEGSPDPLTIAYPLRRTRPWSSFEPAIFVESPGLGAVLTSPFVLRGSASVFEGSFTAVLIDSSGRRISRKQIQASQGAPGRGSFRMTIPFTTSATEGTLVVYDLSMEDGSRLDEVRIPITIAQD
jgi:germination protein M